MPRPPFLVALILVAAACSGDAEPPRAEATTAIVDLDADTTAQGAFFDLPFPSDLRLHADGTPDLEGYPNPRDNDLVANLLTIAEDRPGFPVVPVAYFRFTGPLPERTPDEVIPADVDSPILLIDVDPESDDRGRLVPTIASTVVSDRYTGDDLLAVAARPGFVLAPDRTYAVVVRRSLGDVEGEPLGVPPALAALARGETPEGALGGAAATVYAPLWDTLPSVGLDAADVAAATVFTTGDVVADLYALSERVREAHDVDITGLRLDPSDGADHDRYCELVGTMSLPQFQRGEPPFDTEGIFEMGADGLPVEQRREDSKITLTIPKTEMPSGGYPLMVYFHGSGGVSAQVVDRGPLSDAGVPIRGQGPAYVVAEHGFAAVGAALPLSPDRLPGASETEYLNFANLAAFRDTFRQGVLEQRLMIDALQTLEIDPATLAGCDGPTLPAGETAFHFDTERFVGLGQSMGGMYTNLIGAVEPRLKALVPTGAGGLWSYFILQTSLVPGARDLLGIALVTDADALSHLHPAMHLVEIAWEAAEPFVYMPRLSRRPLPELDPRPIYEPVGMGDSYFPISVYDAVALAYHHREAGDEVWPSMQRALSLASLDGIEGYPVRNDLESVDGTPYTGAVVQYAGDGRTDPHEIFVHLPEVRYQYGCFLRTAIDGDPVILAPAPLGTPCE